MDAFVLSNEIAIRLGFSFGLFTLLVTWEHVAPRRTLCHSRTKRWVSNLGVALLNTLAVRFLFPLLPLGMAMLAQRHRWGLLHYTDPPYWLAAGMAVVVLDLAIYLQHVLFHVLPILWRIHRVHHADLDFDVTTGLRFHPLEIILSMGIKLAFVALLGPPPVSVVIFDVLLNATSMFNHGNIHLPATVDRVVRLLLVTPDMHRVHHSVILQESNTNFGFNLAWWDRLFGTYRDQPAQGHAGMTIGLDQFRDVQCVSLPWMLQMPFIRPSGM